MHYDKNYLTKVILKLDFGPIPSLLDPTGESGFTNLIKEKYPVLNPKPTTTINVNVGPGGPVVQQQISGMIWEHKPKSDSSKSVFLSNTFLSTEYGKNEYDHFPAFFEEIEYLFSKFQSIYHLSSINRIGLRYINEVNFEEGDPLDWSGFIAEDKIKGVLSGFNKDSMNLLRSMHMLHLKKENMILSLNYGIFNSEYPNPVARRNFLIDLDGSISNQIPSDQVLESVHQLNALCEEAFEDCIGDGLREKMGVIDGDH